MRSRGAWLVFVLIGGSACSTVGDGAGVSAALGERPQWGCVSSVVRELASIEVLAEKSASLGKRVTLHGLEPLGSEQSMIFRLEGVVYALQITAEPGGVSHYTNYSIFKRDAAPLAEIQRSLDVTVALANKVERTCHVSRLTEQMTTHCRIHGKECPRNEPVV